MRHLHQQPTQPTPATATSMTLKSQNSGIRRWLRRAASATLLGALLAGALLLIPAAPLTPGVLADQVGTGQGGHVAGTLADQVGTGQGGHIAARA